MPRLASLYSLSLFSSAPPHPAPSPLSTGAHVLQHVFKTVLILHNITLCLWEATAVMEMTLSEVFRWRRVQSHVKFLDGYMFYLC